MGGSYELIDADTVVPNPDYWLLWIWKQLVGNKMFASKLVFENGTDGQYVHGYALEGKKGGSFVIPLVNFHVSNHAQIDIEINGATDVSYSQYVLQGAGSNDLHSDIMEVNKHKMQYKDGAFPQLVPQAATNVVDLPPATMS